MAQATDLPLVFELDASGTDVSAASGQTSSLDCQDNSAVVWTADLTALSGGTTPDVTFAWQHSPDDSTWYAIATESALSAAGTKARLDVEHVFRYVRVAWATTGAPTTASADIWVQARRR